MIQLPPLPDDDPEFLTLAERLLSGMLRLHSYRRVYIVRIDNWFGHRWMGFCGAIYRLEIRGAPLAIPPFHPHRVTWQETYRRTEETEAYEYDGVGWELHTIQPGYANVTRYIRGRDKTLMFWFSGNSRKNRAGSLMGYHIDGNVVEPWYLSLHCTSQWCEVKRKGNFPQVERID